MDPNTHPGLDGASRQSSKNNRFANRRLCQQATQLTFINTNDHEPAATLNKLSQIRSHVAKDIHARARQKRIDNLQVRNLPPRPKNASKWSSEPRGKSQAAHNEPREGAQDLNVISIAASSSIDVLKRMSHPPILASNRIISSPQSSIGYGQPFAREISEAEKFMLSSRKSWIQWWRSLW